MLSHAGRCSVPQSTCIQTRRLPSTCYGRICCQLQHLPAFRHPGSRAVRQVTGRAAEQPPPATDQESEGLLPEEDQEVPGTYWDALNGNTKLGKAVRAACEELEHLNQLEMGVLQEAETLLKQLGMKGTLFAAPAQQQEDLLDQGAQQEQQQQQQQPSQQP